MEPKLTTLCTYPSAIQAESVKWALEQEGITTFVADSNTITADWFNDERSLRATTYNVAPYTLR